MNTKSKFTPGPWEACEVLNGLPHTEIREENFGTLKAQFFGGDHRRNAVLCAAAPDLLAALERIESALEDGSVVLDQTAIEDMHSIARAAIAKAKGVK